MMMVSIWIAIGAFSVYNSYTPIKLLRNAPHDPNRATT